MLLLKKAIRTTLRRGKNMNLRGKTEHEKHTKHCIMNNSAHSTNTKTETKPTSPPPLVTADAQGLGSIMFRQKCRRSATCSAVTTPPAKMRIRARTRRSLYVPLEFEHLYGRHTPFSSRVLFARLHCGLTLTASYSDRNLVFRRLSCQTTQRSSFDANTEVSICCMPAHGLFHLADPPSPLLSL
jgi:hypothetical protein